METALNKKGQLAGLAGIALSLMVIIIITMAVVIPVSNSVYDMDINVTRGGSGMNGTARTVLGYNQLLLATLVIVAVVGGIGAILGGRR